MSFILGILLYVLFFGQTAHEHIPVRDGYDVAVKALGDDGSGVGGVDYAAPAAVQAHVLPYDGIPVGIPRYMLPHRTPASQVAPSQILGHDTDPIRLLHHGIVDRNLPAGGEKAGKGLSLLFREEIRVQSVHNLGDVGGVLPYLGYDSFGGPDEDSCIPEIITFLQIGLRGFEVRLFLELAHFHDLTHLGGGRADVAVAGFRTGGSYPHGDYAGGALGGGEGLGYHPREILRLKDQGVRRSNDDVGEGELLLYFPAGVGDAGGGVPRLGLKKYLVLRYERQLLPYKGRISLRCDHPEVLPVADWQEPLESHLDQGFADSEDVQELLGAFRGAGRPEPAPDSARHYHDVGIW